MKRLFIGIIFIFTVLSSAAQDNATNQQSADTVKLTMSLQEAQDYAVIHNRKLQNAALSIKQAEAGRWQAIASMLPQVAGKLDYMNLCGYSMNMGGMSIPMNPYGTIGLTASMALSGTQIVSSLITELSVDMSDIGARKSEQLITSGVTTTYISILAMQETVELLKLNKKNLDDLYNMTLQSVQVGVSEQTDADQISVQVATMSSSINNVERQIEVLYNSLRLLLGTTVNAQITLSENLDNVLSAENTMLILNEQLILGENYDYQLAQKQTQLAQKEVTLAAMSYVPTLSGFYQYNAKSYFGEAEGMNMTPPSTVGVSLNVPIFSSGQKAASVKQKGLALTAAENTFLDTQDNLKIQDAQYRYDLKSAYENYEIQKQNINVTQKVFDNISKKFEFGYGSSLDVTNTSTNLLTAQTNYISSMLEMVQAYINLKNLLNK